MRTESLSFLRRLLDTPSPSGFEHDGQRLWLDYTKPLATKTWSDAYGNCFAELLPTRGLADNTRTIAVCGHADEIGLMVNHVDSQGFVYCKAIGGIDSGSIVGKRIQFRSSVAGVTDPVIGLVGATAIHLQDKDAGAKVRKVHELFIDIGGKDQAATLARLNIGDAGVFLDTSMMLSDELIVARALDNRIGTFVAAETLRLVAEQRALLNVRVVAVSTVQEEVGLNGAAMIAESLRPDIALVTDVGHSTDSPGISHPQHGQFKMGEGPKLAIGGALHPAIVARLTAAAAAKTIPLQRAATPGRSGTDTDAIFLRAGGIPCGLLSLPIRYMHTTVELGNIRDLRQISEVFAAMILDFQSGESITSGL
ncbi:MAG: M42 family peptidase [Phycisphaerales bacterium]|nr:M42 family peptidase [Phycisphaerales bacterium]